MEREVETLETAVTEINKKRKFSQMRVGEELFKIHEKMVNGIYKNKVLEGECMKLEG